MTTSFPVATVHGGPEERTDFDRLMKGPNAYRTISEVADELHVPQHVLRFWETRFPEVKPLKRGGGRRYYSPADIEILRRITDLLYVQGYTIKGVQRVLKEQMGAFTTPTASAMPVVDPAPLPPAFVPAVEAGRTSFEIPAFQPSEPDHVHSGPRDVEGALTDAGISSEAMADEFRDSGHETQGSHAGPAVETPGDEDLDRADQHPDQSEGSCDGDHTPQDGGEISPGPVETILDPGEETSASAMVSPAEDTSAEQTPQPVHPAGLSGVDEALVTILQDELVALRTEQGRWKQERRALRLALEDVLGELDSLRAMLPQA